jgi:mRNA-degrading endonuclease RelE of RelBE toxin-antitoxin system
VAYRIEFSPEADEHVARLKAHQRTKLLDMIERQLISQPTIQTRQRRPLRPNPVAQYRLRIGELRVYYDVREAPERLVIVKAVGIKVRDRVRVGGEEIEL